MHKLLTSNFRDTIPILWIGIKLRKWRYHCHKSATHNKMSKFHRVTTDAERQEVISTNVW